MQKSVSKSLPKHLLLLIAGGVFILLIGWFIWVQIMPRPLGDKLEYIGKSDYGCWWICDSEPGITYYYGTDMTAEEVAGYFRKASIVEKPYKMSNSQFIVLSYMGSDYSLDFYEDKSLVQGVDASKTSKPNVMTIDASNYDLAKGSL